MSGSNNPKPAFTVPEVEVYLKPGDWHFGGPRTCIRTTLGSCIAFTLWHPETKLGGMCHYMLPRRPGRPDTALLDGRYASDAMQLLEQAARNKGILLQDCETKMFGGADMFRLPASHTRSVATQNIAAAERLVTQYGLQLGAQDVGGNRYRQIIFLTDSGDVWVRQGLEPDHNSASPKRAGR